MKLNELTYQKAMPKDIETLVKVRTEVLRAANKLTDDIDMSLVETNTRTYYEKHFKDDSHCTYMVYDGDMFAGCGSISFYEVMPTYHNPSGKKAYIMNMYTRPSYRRRGIAIKMLDLLVQEAKLHDIMVLSLEATEMGRPLYEKYGFTAMKDEMELLL